MRGKYVVRLSYKDDVDAYENKKARKVTYENRTPKSTRHHHTILDLYTTYHHVLIGHHRHHHHDHSITNELIIERNNNYDNEQMRRCHVKNGAGDTVDWY